MNDFFSKEETLAQHKEMTDTITAQMAGLATKAQADEILKVFKAILLAVRITSSVGRFTYKTALWLAPLIASVAVIWAFVKGGLSNVILRLYP